MRLRGSVFRTFGALNGEGEAALGRITIRIDDDLHAQLTAEAQAAGVGLSDVVRSRLARPPQTSGIAPTEKAEDRTERLPVYLSATEFEQVTAAAQQHRMSGSGFLRSLGLRHRLPPALGVFTDIRHELSRQGHNLNQLVRLAQKMKFRRDFPSDQVVLEVLGRTVDQWIAAGDRLDASMAEIESKRS